MGAAAKLTDLIDGVDLFSDDWSAYFDRETGRVLTLSPQVVELVEADADEVNEVEDRVGVGLDDVEPDLVALARQVIEATAGPRYVALPGKFEFHEYRHMQDFIREQPEGRGQDDLGRSIQGKGAYRRFKDTAARLGLLDRWYAYRDEALKALVLDWAQANDVEVNR